jgi:predicted acylesterase/phospholipase RssA
MNESLTNPLAGKRIGLVLTGGGGKGAYEIGVWRGLIAKHITQFSAISGTSIGALNGYLVARGKLDDAEKLWRKLGQKSPLRVSPLRIAFGLLERIGIGIVLALTAYVFLPFVGLLGILPIFASVFIVTNSGLLLPARLLLPMLAVLNVLLVKRLLRNTRIGRVTNNRNLLHNDRDLRRFIFFSFQPWMFHLLTLAGTVVLPLWMFWRDVLVHNRSHHWAWLLPIPFVIGIFTILFSVDLGLSSMSQIPIFDGSALERELEDLFKSNSRTEEGDSEPRLDIQTDLYATRLVERAISLPPAYVPPDFSNATVLGMEYVPLREKPISHIREVLTSTGAIAGFLPRVYEKRSEISFTVSGLPYIYYDAGSIDNTPMAPLLEDGFCDVYIVVLLDHTINDPMRYLRKYIDSINFRVRRANPDISDEAWNALAGFRVIYPSRISSDKFNDVQIIPIVPSEPLGGFFRGTLRFKSAQIEQHMQCGTRDAQSAIDAFAKCIRRSSGASDATKRASVD